MIKLNYKEMIQLLETKNKENIIELSEQVCALLNQDSKEYYNDGTTILSQFEYDKLSELLEIYEKETNYIHPNSPINQIGYEVVENIEKVKHKEPSLSLSKTKDREELKEWLGDRTGFIGWKLDGLTIVLTYKNGKLYNAATRGNGLIGRDITHNAIHFHGVPNNIEYKGTLVLRGEALISKEEFQRINNDMPEDITLYKNPRNLVSGTVQQKDSNKIKERKVNFKAFTLVSMDETLPNKWSERLLFLEKLGFDIVEYDITNKETLDKTMDTFFKEIENYKFETDGLVLFYEDANYVDSLGNTNKYPRGGKAFKWKDEIVETTLQDVIWTGGKTGVLTPTAVFNTVQIEGSDVSKASVHNLSILESLKLGKGDTISVYKANMIIPQIYNNLNETNTLTAPPKNCPYCNHATIIKESNGTKMVFCDNQNCSSKNMKLYTNFCAKEAMDINGLSIRTIETFVEEGFIKNFIDIFSLNKYENEIINMDNFGEKSYKNLIASLEKAKHTNLAKLLAALSIPDVGVGTAKLLSNYAENDANKIKNLSREELSQINGIGEIIANSVYDWFKDEENLSIYEQLLNILVFEQEEKQNSDNKLEGKTFVITGEVEHFKNRNEMKLWIENHGGKVSGSVSKTTFALITNDKTTNTGKSKEAKKLGINIINENDLLSLI